jgi:outer membrane protein OmpA-like peptidoglycan-associated protein
LDEAEKAFAHMVKLGAETRYLNTKFLFKVNSIDFGVVEEDTPEVKALISRYPLQLRQIAKHFSYNQDCLLIVGHSSKTGTPEYNRQLALERAQTIQALLHADFPSILSRTVAQGKGFDECVVCTGSDDNLDAIDRRVEFKVMPCEELNSRYSMF